jgi:hypothetical protein
MVMKKLFERLHKGPKLDPLTEARLTLARLRKLLENARAIMNLLTDGQEKLREEYIFDRHYVTSLVDQVIERSGMLVFDAVVLAPEGGEALYLLHDKLKAFAVDQFIKGSGETGIDNTVALQEPIPEEPELRLLARVLTWATGQLPNGIVSAMDFIRRIFDHIIPVFRDGRYFKMAKSWLELEGAGVKHQIRVIGLETETIKEDLVFINDLECRPLGMMFIGAGQEQSENKGQKQQPIRKWIAFIGKEHLSLRGIDTDNKVYLEATFSGHMDSDFIFIFSENPMDPKAFIPPAFHIEKTELGTLAWSYDVSGQNMENSLTQLGTHLLGSFCGERIS